MEKKNILIMALASIIAIVVVVFFIFVPTATKRNNKKENKYNVTSDNTEALEQQSEEERIDELRKQEESYTGVEEADYESPLPEGYNIIIDNSSELPENFADYADLSMIKYYINQYFLGVYPDSNEIYHIKVDLNSANANDRNISFIFYLGDDISKNYVCIYDIKNHGSFIDTIDLLKYNVECSESVQSVIDSCDTFGRFKSVLITYARYFTPDSTNFRVIDEIQDNGTYELSFSVEDVSSGEKINCIYDKSEEFGWMMSFPQTEI